MYILDDNLIAEYYITIMFYGYVQQN